jgi:Ca-activated chloride channel homolog
MVLKRVGLALLFSSILSVTAIAEGQRVILVLDASGSMRGKINGKTKMDIAKDIVGKVVGTWDPKDDLGLVVYGHREKGSCTDIETVMPPRPLTLNEYMSPIKALQPKGKTPMTQAVRQAAEALKYTEQKSTIILVSDGVETCDADPCAVARELEKAGVGLTVHTVGFGLDDKAAVDQLKCLAEETGGIAVLADDSDQLEKALRQTVEAKVEEPPPPPAPEPVDVKGFKGHAIMAEGVEIPQPFDAYWEFYRDVNGELGEHLSSEVGNKLKVEMKGEGPLIVRITAGTAKLLVPFTYANGTPYAMEANLNAGYIKFIGMMDEGTPLTNQGAYWEVRDSSGEHLASYVGVAPNALLNAGDYNLKVTDENAVVETTFTVVAGKTAEQVVILNSGIVNITATYDGKQAAGEGTALELHKAPDISGAKEHVDTEFGPKKQIRATAGDYVIIAKLNIATAEVPIKIVAGQAVSADVNLNAGFVAVKAAGAKRIDIQSEQPGIDGKRIEFGREYAEALNYAANTGSYHIIAYGNDDEVLGEKDVAVVAGQRVEVSIP